MPEAFLDRALVSTIKRCRLERFALKALLEASRLLALSFGLSLGKVRDEGDPVQQLGSLVELLRHLLRQAEESREILGARWDKLPRRQRPFYTPELRFRILKVKEALALSTEETARRFRVW